MGNRSIILITDILDGMNMRWQVIIIEAEDIVTAYAET
jgi:hypothetical protein